MRKFTALLLTFILLTLSACTGAESYAPTPTPRPTVTRSPLFPPTPTPPPPAEPIQYEPVDVPDYYPPLDFEVESVWRAKDIEYEGDAVMYISAETDGVRTFKVFMYNYTEYTCYNGEPPRIRTLSPDCFVADAYTLGTKLYFSSQSEALANLTGLSGLSGELVINEDTATIRYTEGTELYPGNTESYIEFDFENDIPQLRYVNIGSGQNYTQYLPTQFTRVAAKEAGQAMYTMPMFPDEIIIPPGAMDGSSASYTTDDPDYIPELRGVKLGDSLMSVLSRFMCEPEKLVNIEKGTGGESAVIYGTATYWANFGAINYESGLPASIIFACHIEMGVTFYLDENLSVSSVRYVEPW